MQTSIRSRDTGASFAARRGHLPQLSISDESHHVTETIGYLYDDEHENESRQHSISSRQHANSHHPVMVNGSQMEEDSASRGTAVQRKQLPPRRGSSDNGFAESNGGHVGSPVEAHPWDQHRGSPSPVHDSHERSPSDTATSQFPLNNVDYESSPAGLAQELSNLQALRRMSMNVGATDDPDLPQISAAAMPNAPSSSSSEDDASRLFWVPARLHPELAPKEFKTFLESKAEQIRRRSGELSAFTSPSSSKSASLSPDGVSPSSLRRKKSMLSRQIDSSVGYQDGAERLERKKSQSPKSALPDPNLQELETLVATTTGLSNLSLERPMEDETGDIILPSVPGSSLKRSTRTTYRRGGSVKGRGADRGTYAQRAARRAAAESPTSSRPESPEAAVPAIPALPNFASMDVSNLAQTLKDPAGSSTAAKTAAPNFSRLAGRDVSPPSSVHTASPVPSSVESVFSNDDVSRRPSTASMPEMRKPLPVSKSPPPTTPSFERKSVPQIVEVPPPEEPQKPVQPPRSSSMQSPVAPVQQPPMRHPERVSSRDDRSKTASPQRPPMPSKQSLPSLTGRSPSANAMPPPSRPAQSLEQPSPLPGNDTNTSNLSFIPTLTVDKRADNKKKEDGKKSSWSWLLGKEDGDKEKPEKPKAKISKPPQQHDNTRLDVLQTSIDGVGKGRESLVLDRESLKLDEERKKESQRKSSSSGESKKEKEGLFSSIFGGKKTKAEKENSSKKHRDRGLSPEPPYRELKPDIDYNWTRFSILEERAIYRMAHIKLANPRRALHSQVLLSNFMYSYLAKVQQMHPQMNLPTSAKQQRQQQQPQPQGQAATSTQPKDQETDEYAQYQRYQQQQLQQQSQSSDEQQQQPYSPQQGANGTNTGSGDTIISSGYEYQTGAEGQSPSHGHGQRPGSRGSKFTVESNVVVYGVSGGGGGAAASGGGRHSNQQQQYSHSTTNKHHHLHRDHHQQQQQQQQQRQGHQYGMSHLDDDDDDDMW
ncbi:hypothetical protein HRR83_005304 [Exophiala dermatitidis]|uniref:Protein Zds1 C-terminal domain-containing protein n=2 Tax=Exophiala dermatitidis TaxID=5970 RepID=H6C1Q6_EXODN|nr:uncharacterized protein HMPREF1120_05809 [Exophiala dermatitidis NIH/UT8656]KAJ4512961.1 hypothetical protein HRR75_004728 [Exophiala dermatitidis]EHY57785.1 hypothetical protein HMPREF1120_05809 [Exophiala dermatitidis NIH/UT8656]KAJ4515999.1 hypothetical protein HRR74_005156 [Exophiala dermatitidis]KAJ4518595.1 hypothetical protein HRR73_004176 [Exophiala dermatitidis]KAJ4534105.1 hypothetical protein HRR76_006042 [Exophiala dermatitidis]